MLKQKIFVLPVFIILFLAVFLICLPESYAKSKKDKIQAAGQENPTEQPESKMEIISPFQYTPPIKPILVKPVQPVPQSVPVKPVSTHRLELIQTARLEKAPEPEKLKKKKRH